MITPTQRIFTGQGLIKMHHCVLLPQCSLLAYFWVLVLSIIFGEVISRLKIIQIHLWRRGCWKNFKKSRPLFTINSKSKVLIARLELLGKVIVEKSRREPFFMEKIWDLGWFWANTGQYWKKLRPLAYDFWGRFLNVFSNLKYF